MLLCGLGTAELRVQEPLHLLRTIIAFSHSHARAYHLKIPMVAVVTYPQCRSGAHLGVVLSASIVPNGRLGAVQRLLSAV